MSRAKSFEEAQNKSKSPSKHKWLVGNLPLESLCCVCDEPAGDGPGLRDLRCVWCQRKVHTECQPLLEDTCDLGRHRNLIVPPERVVIKQGRTVAAPRRKVISQLLPREDEKFHPLIVVANTKSGSSDGASVLAGFRRQLNPAQVIELGESRMEEALEWCQLASPTRCYVLACGGDGTIGWVLNTADKMKLATPPAVAIFPLGTGNDLARTLGWGAGSDSSEDVCEAMARIERAQVAPMDRWKVGYSRINTFTACCLQYQSIHRNFLMLASLFLRLSNHYHLSKTVNMNSVTNLGLEKLSNVLLVLLY